MAVFKDYVLGVVKQIPRGRVLTYAQVAKLSGSPKASRAVGNILHNNHDFTNIPCHRVIKSDGGVGGYVQGAVEKVKKLKQEGVEILDGKVNLDKHKAV